VNTLSTDHITAHSEGRIDQFVRNETCRTNINESMDWFGLRLKKKTAD